jgi:CRP-like cAMP-binding protein
MGRSIPPLVGSSAASPPRLLRFGESQVVYEQGDVAKSWFEVQTGIARTCRFFPDGDRHVIEFYFPGDVFGLERPWREDTAEAVGALEVHRRDHWAVRPVADNEEARLEAALRSTRDYIYLLGHRSAEQRVAAFLLRLAERTGAKREVAVPMSRADIADHLRLTIHTISRTISGLCRRGLIRLRNPQAVSIIDEPALRRLAGETALTPPVAE